MPERTEDSSPPFRRHLGLLLLVAGLVRLPDLTAPLVMADDWGSAQFLVYARNYRDLGPMLEWTIPCFGVVGGRGMVYANHPWLASLLLGIWGLPFNYSEAAYRSLALVFSLVSIAAIARLGEKLYSARAGLMAATLFAFSPLSIHFGRIYTMEAPHIAFLLLAYIEYLSWRDNGTRYIPCVAYLALAQGCDIFGLFFCPWLFFLWLKDRFTTRARSDAGWWGLMLTPVVVQAVLMAIVARRSLGGHSWQRGVSRAGRPWHDWVDPGYWMGFANKLLWNYGYVLPVLAFVALLAWRSWPARQRERWLPDLAFWWFYPVLYTLLGTEWMKHHLYLVGFWGPVLALQAGLFLASKPARTARTAVGVIAGLSLWLTTRFYFGFLPLQLAELKVASAIRQTVQPGDIVVGLPPHIAYYVDHKATVPYDYFLRSGLTDPAELNALIRKLVGEGKYRRVLVCPGFIQYPEGLPYQDLAHLYPEGGYYTPSEQTDTLQIWTRP